MPPHWCRSVGNNGRSDIDDLRALSVYHNAALRLVINVTDECTAHLLGYNSEDLCQPRPLGRKRRVCMSPPPPRVMADWKATMGGN